MKELLEITAACANSKQPMALATIVETSGSSYRRPGARMLILENGQTVGCLSGGCLDRDVALHGLEVIKHQRAKLLDYDTASDADALFGTGVGCQGVIHILLEFIPPKKAGGKTISRLPDFIHQLFQSRSIGALATVIRSQGENAPSVGDRVMLAEIGIYYPQARNHSFNRALLKYAEAALDLEHSKIMRLQSAAFTADIFVERIAPPPNLVIFGGGHDALPVARLAKEVGFRVTVVDWRPAFSTPERFPQADRALVATPEKIAEHLAPGEETAAIIMSHNYLADQAALQALLPLDLRYLGLMGPRKRAEKMLQALAADGFQVAAEKLRQLHNPAGLDIGAESPEQIALSIIGEIQAVLANHAGGQLCEKREAIHQPRLAAPRPPEPVILRLHESEPLCEASA